MAFVSEQEGTNGSLSHVSTISLVINCTTPSNPVPTIASISPNSAMAGAPAFTLTVFGSNYVSNSVVRWNGSDRATTFFGNGEVRASILASDIASQGSASVTVYNPSPGGGTSNPSTFTITAASVNVTVHQFLADGSTEVGTLGLWNGSSFGSRLPAPQTYTFPVPSTQTLHGDTLIYSNQKHRIWKKLSAEEPNVINHHQFSVASGFSTSLNSQFLEARDDITIKTDLLDAPGTTGGSVEFRDPWYIDFSDPNYGNAPRNRGQVDAVLYTRSVGANGFRPDYTTPFDGGRIYRGVFLNQVPDPNDLNKPYYSVGAPSSQTIGGFESYFVKWDDSQPTQIAFQNASALQTGVVFKQSGATATANYKGHLVSSLSSATGPNNQRKIVCDETAAGGVVAYHLVYESSGEIWYCKSLDGVSWSWEKQISSGGGFNANPSIAFSSNSPTQRTVRIAWVNTQNKTVHYRQGVLIEASENPIQWSDIEQVAGAAGVNHDQWRPVVSESWVAYNKINEGGATGEIRVHKRLALHNWTTGGTVPTSNVVSVHPTITAIQETCYIAFAHTSSGEILYNEVTANGSTLTWEGANSFAISTGSALTDNATPNISFNDCEGNLCAPNRVFVAWRGWNATGNKNEIAVRRKDLAASFNSWGAFANFGSNLPSSPPPPSFSNPVIVSAGNGDMNVTWWGSDNNQWAAKFKANLTKWSGAYKVGVSTNQYPSLSNGPVSTDVKTLTVNGTAAPYVLSTFTLPPPPQISSNVVDGWNMTGIPVVVFSFVKADVYPTPPSASAAFGYNNGYVPTDPLTNNRGWYIKFTGNQTITYEGDLINHMEMVANNGWNIIGSISSPVDVANITTNPSNIIIPPFYKYQNGYTIANTLHPGGGFWVKTNASGAIILNADPQRGSPQGNEGGLLSNELDLESYDKFILTDAGGGEQELYVRNGALAGISEDVEMPPSPPDSAFDVRFSSDAFVRTVFPDSGMTILSILLNEVVYPAQLAWEIRPENGISYSMLPDSGGGLGRISAPVSIHGSSSMIMSSRGAGSIRLKLSSLTGRDGSQLPVQFALRQNYPNPFNPTTEIRFDLPDAGNVSLVVYDVLGREVVELENGNREAGYHSVIWNASDQASGVYFARFNVTNAEGKVAFSKINKLMLIR